MYKHLGAAALAILTGPSLAEDRLPDIVVTATGYPISAEEALVPTAVITRREIEQSPAQDLGELLNQVSGLEVARNGGPGQATSLFLRGTESDQNLVMINQVPINTATVASASLGTLDTQLLQRVEVVKGPQSTLWGSGAIGGVIDVSTLQDIAPGSHSFASAGFGRHGMRRLAAGVSHRDADLSATLGASYLQTDGIRTLTASTQASPYDNTSVNLALGRDVGALHLQATHWQTQGTSHYEDFTYPAPTFSLVLVPVSQDFLTSVSTLALNGTLGPDIDSTLQYSLLRDHIDQNAGSDHAHTDRHTLAWRNIVELDNRDVFQFGVQASHEKADILSYGSSYRGATDYQEGWLQYDLTRGAQHVLAGARVLNHEDAGRHLTWSLGYGYHLSPATLLKASLATGFRYPTAVERYMWSANPDLRPERSRALEIGLSHRLDAAQLVELSVFRTDIRDLIVSTGVFPNTKNVNVNEARITGLEAGYRYARGAWSLDSSLIFQDPQDLSNDTRLLRRARFSTKAGLGYNAGPLDARLEAIYSGKRRDVDGLSFVPTSTAPYLLLNLHAGWRLEKGLSLYADIENLADRDYQVVSQYNTPGRTLSFGIRYQGS